MLTLKKLTVDYRQRPLGVENHTRSPYRSRINSVKISS